MAHGVRASLVAVALCLALGIPAASAQTAPPGANSSDGAWTDPPARKSETAKPAPEAPRATAPTQAAAPERSASGNAPAGGAGPPRQTPRRASVRGRRPAPVIAAAPPRPARTTVARREAPVRTRIAVRPRPMREAPRVLAQRPPRVAAERPFRDERFAVYPGYGVGYPAGYADDRLERLRAAEAAGYLVVRRRSVEFPDGRSLRTYRPMEDAGYD